MGTIKNIVFDIGNVLMNWDPEGIYKTLFNKDNYYAHPLSNIVGGEIWLNLDRGTIDLNTAINKLSSLNKPYAEEIDKFIREAPDNIHPISSNVDCALKYRNLGCKIYLLSNFPEHGYNIIRKKYNFFNQFHGEVISWEVQAIKPNKEIYNILLKKYNLDPENTLFIDDLLENITAAEKLNINGLHLNKDTDLEFELKNIVGF